MSSTCTRRLAVKLELGVRGCKRVGCFGGGAEKLKAMGRDGANSSTAMLD